MVGDNVTVTVLGAKGSQVRIGVTAPPDVAVDRSEIRDRKNAGMPVAKPIESAKQR